MALVDLLVKTMAPRRLVLLVEVLAIRTEHFAISITLNLRSTGGLEGAISSKSFMLLLPTPHPVVIQN